MNKQTPPQQQAEWSTISQLVKNKRKELKETQAQFGKRFNLSHAAISDIESGKTEHIGEKMLLFVLGKEAPPAVQQAEWEERLDQQFKHRIVSIFSKVSPSQYAMYSGTDPQIYGEMKEFIRQEFSTVEKKKDEEHEAVLNDLLKDTAAVGAVWGQGDITTFYNDPNYKALKDIGRKIQAILYKEGVK